MKRVALVAVTRHNLEALCKLDAGDGGRQVAPNLRSMAQAAVYPEAWPRAIEAEGELVGFAMLYDPALTPEPEERRYTLWRLMIDVRFQRQGLGHAAVAALVEHVRTRPGADALYTSYVPGEAAERFYRSLGFEPTGELDDDEIVMRLPIDPASDGQEKGR